MKKLFFLFSICAVLVSCSTISIVKKEFSPKIIKEDFFGIHYHDMFEKENKDLVKITDAKYWRLWDSGTLWADLEPSNDLWNFERLDFMVETAKENGIELVFTLGVGPDWACKKPIIKSGYGGNSTTSPPYMEHWKDYVKTLGERYKGAIKYWEIWNEPNFIWFYTGTVGYLADMTKEASVILKNIDPDNKIVSPSITGWKGEPFGIWWLDAFLSYGVADFVDIIGFHLYTGKLYQPENMVYHISELKKLLKRRKIDKPIWNTEGAFTTKNVYGDDAIKAMAKMHIIQLALNVDRFYWYAFNNNLFGSLYDKKKKELNKTGEAYISLMKYLIGNKIVNINKKKNAWIVEIDNEGNKEAILWSEKKKEIYKCSDDFIGKKFENISDGKSFLIENNNLELGKVPIIIKF